MTQMWTISDLQGAVLCPAFETPSADSHPKDNGWDWDPDLQVATRISAVPDLSIRTFSGTAWVANLPALRERKWGEVKAQASIAESWGCTTASGRVQTDADSRGKITGMVVMAMLALSSGQPFDQTFTMADNSSVPINAMDMISIGLAAGAHVVACHAVAQAKRAAIDAAADEAALDVVDISGGWPDAPAG